MSLPPLLSAQSAAAVSDTPMFIPDLGLWLKADAGITLVSGAVDAWADQSGNGRNFSAPAAANRPAYSGTLNGLPVVTFDGTDDSIAGNASSLSLFRNVTGATIFSVIRYNLLVGSNRMTLGIFSGTGGVRAQIGSTDAGVYQIAGRRLDADSLVTRNAGSVAIDENYVRTDIYDYANAQVYAFQNGTEALAPTAFQTAGSTSDTGSTRVELGRGVTAGLNFNGNLAELIVYRRAITPAERATVENYLRSKWGI